MQILLGSWLPEFSSWLNCCFSWYWDCIGINSSAVYDFSCYLDCSGSRMGLGKNGINENLEYGYGHQGNCKLVLLRVLPSPHNYVIRAPLTATLQLETNYIMENDKGFSHANNANNSNNTIQTITQTIAITPISSTIAISSSYGLKQLYLTHRYDCML